MIATDLYTDSWMQKGANPSTERSTSFQPSKHMSERLHRRTSTLQTTDAGGYARSTASSRSRIEGMSQTGIYEAFEGADKEPCTTPTTPTTPAAPTANTKRPTNRKMSTVDPPMNRRKSVAALPPVNRADRRRSRAWLEEPLVEAKTAVNKRASLVLSGPELQPAPRARVALKKPSVEPVPNPVRPTHRRHQSLGTSLRDKAAEPARPDINRARSMREQTTAETSRPRSRSLKSPPPGESTDSPPPSVPTIRTAEQTKQQQEQLLLRQQRRRSHHASLEPLAPQPATAPPAQQSVRRQVSLGNNKPPLARRGTLPHADDRRSDIDPAQRSTRHGLSDYHGYNRAHGRRRSVAYSPPPTQPTENTPPVPPMPRHHSLKQTSRASSTTSSRGGDDTQAMPTTPTTATMARKAALLKTNNNLTNNRRLSRASIADTDSTRSSRASSSDESMRARGRVKKTSLILSDVQPTNAATRARRMSRTESLNEGVPTTGSREAALLWRKQSLAAQATTAGSPKRTPKPSPVKEPLKTLPAKEPPVGQAAAVVSNRKRGKTLPGSLAAPPPVLPAALPPIKVEPIKIVLMPNKKSNLPPKSPGLQPVTRRMSLKARHSISQPNLRTTTDGQPACDHARTTPVTAGETSEDDSSNNNSKTRLVRGSMREQRRMSLKTPRVTPSSPSRSNTSPNKPPRRTLTNTHTADNRLIPIRKQSLSAASKYTDSPSEPSVHQITRKMSVLGTKPAMVQQPTPAVAQGPATRALSAYMTNTRKSSLAPPPDLELSVEPKAVNMQQRLNAMVKEHSFEHDLAALETALVASRTNPGALRQACGIVDPPLLQLLPERPMSAPEHVSQPNNGARTAKTPETILKYYSHRLSLYERQEIRQYDDVYFTGLHSKKHPATPELPNMNYGYDDDAGDYNIVEQDHLGYRYEILEILGQGSFGRVVKCLDHKTGTTQAVKIIRNLKRFHEQARTEVKILQQLVDWDPEDLHHNVRMTDHFYFRNHLCIACECLSINLYEFVKNNGYKGLSLSLIRRFTLQLLQSLSLMYKHGVVHCDLKPENILLKHPSKSNIKVIDFGSSCMHTEQVYSYIQSRFYRSPEIILGMTYNMSIDMWSLGCILAELSTGLPIFPGENEQEQLAYIMEIMGVPERYLIEKSSRKDFFFDMNGNPFIRPNSKGKKRRPNTKTLSHALRCHDVVFLDFIERCLQWDPERRMKPDEALQHEWVTQSTKNRASSGHASPMPNMYSQRMGHSTEGYSNTHHSSYYNP